jgi:hypothetical protein
MGLFLVSIDFNGEYKANNYLNNWNHSTLFSIYSRRINIFSLTKLTKKIEKFFFQIFYFLTFYRVIFHSESIGKLSNATAKVFFRKN